MGRRVLPVTLEFVLDMVKRQPERPRYYTVERPLPDDARLVDVRVLDGQRVIDLVMESDAWADDGDPVLDQPIFHVHEAPGG